MPASNLANNISTNAYLRERLNPGFGDFYYLHLSDLAIALKNSAQKITGKVLDCGCGGSPYQSLFSECQYFRADYLKSDGLDYIIEDDGGIKEKDDFFDCVLSTQVLEHVRYPEKYLTESCRLLKLGGRLILSTHGTFEDHGCPYDFQRWTVDGLRNALEEAGFEVIRMQKLTTNLRAVLLLAEKYFEQLWESRRSRLGWGLWFFQRWFWLNRVWRNRWLDKKYPNYRVVEADSPEHPLYVAILVEAVKR